MFIFLIACAGSKDIDGIWAILIPGAVEADCSESISHNFTDAFVPDDDEDSDQPFVSEQETESSEAMQLIQITRHSKREATLIKGTRAYPGSLGDNGAWKFEWGGNDITTTTQTHQDGYDYTADEDVTTTTTIRLTKNKETVGGTWTGVTHTIAGYTETDAWSSEITEVGDRGQIPSALYLITDVTGAERNVLPRTSGTSRSAAGATVSSTSTSPVRPSASTPDGAPDTTTRTPMATSARSGSRRGDEQCALTPD